MKKGLDIVLINPGDRRQVYQDLSKDYSAVEPPFLVAVIAAYLRTNSFSVAIIDANADNLSPDETAEKTNALNPLLAAVIVYGSQPSASTQNMTVAGKICRALKEKTSAKIAMGGLHPSALPGKTVVEESVDFVVQGEGPLTLKPLLETLKGGRADYAGIPGLWRLEDGGLKNNPVAPLIEKLDETLPVAAWDLLPMEKYRAHNWHCFDDLKNRSPYGAIYTSFGCPYSCVFCCINAPFGKSGIRYRSPERVIEEIDLLVKTYGIRNIKIVDELFVFKESHYMGIVDLIIKNGYNLNLWAYARVDTVKSGNLKKMKQAGINWLALGIESGNPDVRDGASKRMRISDIKQVVRKIQDEGIRVIGNFIFGLPDDTMETMQETLDAAMDLNCEFPNFYCAMAYPGSKLYDIAIEEAWEMPAEWHGYSQHSYEMLPLPTKHIGAREVLQFRDNSFHTYFANPDYLSMIEEKFGAGIREHLLTMSSVRLKRRLLGD